MGCTDSLTRSLCIAAILFDGRPFWAHGKGWRREFRKFRSGVNYLPAHYCEDGFESLDRLFRDGKVVLRKDGEIR